MTARAKERLPRAGEPRIVDRAPRRVAVVRTTGDPARAAKEAVPALYRAVYTLKLRRTREGHDFQVEPLRARWPNANDAPRERWQGYEVAGPHEEEYLSRPGSPRPRTLIRYPVRRRR